MFVRKGYCRFCGIKCRHFKVKEGIGYCKKRMSWNGKYASIIRNEKTGSPKNVSLDRNVNIKAPSWCHKL